ncbi:MAG TPA: septal ring lytic transglycosylase RlpA family protein [Crenalkalicoccus sp.]|jgi:rare lipoprotein A|nr:septal ring lytic transglycosylase RlpA family protein [Crenalkalicoccus sp.]
MRVTPMGAAGALLLLLAAPVGAEQQPPGVGQTQRGQASYYGPRFSGRTMANGKPMNPQANIAAHRTLPLGTTARVTNLQNGRSTVVRVEDRGPYARGRVIDVTPQVAEQLDMKHGGTAPVAVTPLHQPERDGGAEEARR